MAIFLRGDVWWLEYRTRRERIVKATGFHRADKAKAQAVLDAIRFARKTHAAESVVRGMVEAAVGRENPHGCDLPLSAVPDVFADWMRGKGRTLAENTRGGYACEFRCFGRWAEESGLSSVGDVGVAEARAYAKSVANSGRSNKTVRNRLQMLSHAWSAIGQIRHGIANPWPAAIPDRDGSAVRREAFSPAQEAAVLAAAREVGHDWYRASVIARWTGLRYGDVAALEWPSVDMDGRVVRATPSKTRRHGVSVAIPMSGPLFRELAATPEKSRTGFVLPEHAMNLRLGVSPPFSAVLAAAGIKGPYTFHSWRHTFRTRLAAAGVPDEIARRLGGWTNLSMAAHYDHAERLDEAREAIERMQGEKEPPEDAG